MKPERVKCPNCGNVCDEDDGEYCIECHNFLEWYECEEVE